jgi:hypothetical protein
MHARSSATISSPRQASAQAVQVWAHAIMASIAVASLPWSSSVSAGYVRSIGMVLVIGLPLWSSCHDEEE